MAPAITSRPARILFIDAYDSFANNIVVLVRQSLDAEVTTVRIDDWRFHNNGVYDHESFLMFLKDFDAVIAGPGPGSAMNPKDVGVIAKLWDLEDDHLLPILGICLGFQSLAARFGAKVERLQEPRHGIITEVLHKEQSIMRGLGDIAATQYHSLCVNIGHSIQKKRAVSYPAQLWQPSEDCPDLVPLGWDFDSVENGAVLMAMQHAQRPFWGVQYHPESICTNDEGAKVLHNWWTEAQIWLHKHRKCPIVFGSKSSMWGSPCTPDDWPKDVLGSFDQVQPPNKRLPSINAGEISPEHLASLIAHGDGDRLPNLPPTTVNVMTCGSGRLRVDDVCRLLRIPEAEAIVLESGLKDDLMPSAVGTGRYSIIGLFIPNETLRLHYYVSERRLELRTGCDEVYCAVYVDDIWAYLKAVMEQLKPYKDPVGPPFAPFWGGMMGYVSYEAGLDTIDVSPPPDMGGSKHPDICFAYVTRSIVFDHTLKKIFVQSIRGEDRDWIDSTVLSILKAVREEKVPAWDARLPKGDLPELDEIFGNFSDSDQRRALAAIKIQSHYLRSLAGELPTHDEYCEKVLACQESIAAGNSYELCLTDQTVVGMAKYATEAALPWHLYRKLMRINSAPFGAYIRIGQDGHGVHILSSSPERFMSWDRNGKCQCRPIKGTVKKGPNVTRADAEAILNSSKERAENLMIVDLVRHQLHGVYGAGNVEVKQLMEVEEYETVYQLVSVIEGVPLGVHRVATPDEWEDPFEPATRRKPTEKTGIDVFAASLPPGSMTGAPKKRSCELLKDIEGGQPRGIYAGVLGYLDVGGGGDFSVVIRTAVKRDDEFQLVQDEASGETKMYDVWRIGAGGAVTAQSTAIGEYEEMCAKRDSTLRMFVAPSKEEEKRAENLMKMTMTGSNAHFPRIIDFLREP